LHRIAFAVVSTEAWLLLHDLLARGTHPKHFQHFARLSSIQLTLDRYSHWIPSIGRYAAKEMDEALGKGVFAKLALGCIT
jgi:hypothetical protein